MRAKEERTGVRKTAERAGKGTGKVEETGTVSECDKAYLHWLYQAAGISSRGFLRSLAPLGTAKEIYGQLCSGKLSERVAPRYAKKMIQMSEFSKDYDVAGAYEMLRERGVSLVTEQEAAFPKRLKEIPDPPWALYYVGKLPQAEKKAVALIGARDCSEYGRYMAGQFGAAFAKGGVQVISGMARGIDGIGQSAALREGGYSLGILGCGVDICYPRENQALYDALLVGGGVCSEYPPGVMPKSVLFPPRNRIISGFCDAVFVVEARERSGTLITVDMALEQGKEVYALPGRATDPLSGGCNRLIRQGAGLVCTPEQLLEELYGESAASAGGTQTKLVFLEGVQGELLEILDFSPLPAEELQRRYLEKQGKPIALPLLFQELLELCACGYAGQVGGSYFMRILKS